MKNVISLGAGVQSTAMYIMSSRGELPRADIAIFADTGGEKTATWNYLNDFLLPWMDKNNGIPITIVQKKNLYADILKSENSTGQRFASIPAFTVGEDGERGMLRRQCTNEYKIQQVDQAVREWHGLAFRQKNIPTYIWKGISLDEIERLSIPQDKWKHQVYPFVGYETTKQKTTRIDWAVKMTRADIVAWFMRNDLPIPPKSSCTFCPFQSDAAWYDMKVNHPQDFEAAVRVDEAIRNGMSNVKMRNPSFLHESLMPLKDVPFTPGDPDLWRGECLDGCHT